MQYRVIALSVGGRNNKIFKSGDIVKDVNFPEGNISALVKGGFLEPLNTVKTKVESDVEPVSELNLKHGMEISEVTKKQIASDLNKLDIEFDPSASKTELFELLLNHI